VTSDAPIRLPELLLPAGSFDAGIAAIEGGADALYLGFADFSARSQARNFDRTEYRRLLGYAREKGIKLYAALNTVILQGELEGAASLLAFLGRFPPDAVIVQDWGLARIISERHPGLAIHASTQAAVQGVAAARVAAELGASRIVLPRETSLAEMARLHGEFPGMELETFVHGALCYSFSGLCLASGLVLGRSGNRGECAQLCRSYYSADGAGIGRPGGAAQGSTGYWFSCRDLDLSDRLGELAAAGIASLKVEGRMKSPEYCFAVASLYRGLLDRLAAAGRPDRPRGAAPDDGEIAARREAARIAFARSPTEGWIGERGGAALIDSAYPGHRGVPAGRVVSNEGGRLLVELEAPLGLRDGLLGFAGGDPGRPVKFPVLELRDARSGRELVRARAGSRVEMLAEADRRPYEELRPGDALRRISSRELDRRATSPEEFGAARESLDLRLSFSASGLSAALSLPRFDGRAGGAGSESAPVASIEAGEPLPLDLARSAGGLEKALSLFGESGEADFRLVPAFDPGELVQLAPGPDGSARTCAASGLFIPPSALKREKNRIYAKAAELVSAAEAAWARGSAEVGRPAARSAPVPAPGGERPPRAALVFPREGLPGGMPFALPRDLAGSAVAPVWGGRSWLPLAPLVAEREAYAALAVERAAAILDAGSSLMVGLGALHHIPVARELRRRFPGEGGRLGFFLDFNLYVASDPAFASLAGLVEGVEFAYRYLEAEGGAGLDGCGPGLAPCGPGFEAPLFQSLGCFLKHHIVKGACPSPCGKAWTGLLSDRDRRYRVLVEDCVTMLFRIQGNPP
jgi:U32 family peptidase